MIFKPELIEKIVRGEKFQTRRPVKDGEVLDMPLPGLKRVMQNGRIKYGTGRDYAVVPGRGKPGVCWQPELQVWRETGPDNRCDDESKMLRICVLDIRREDVRLISLEDAKAEGFENRIGFWETWCGFYDPSVAVNIGTAFEAQVLLRRRPDELYQAWAYTFGVVK